jgi:chitin disaccharide deacetylase
VKSRDGHPNSSTTRRAVVFNADDFGFSTEVNAGIVHCHREGVLGATTLMANGVAFEDAVRLAKETPTLDVGCHLALMQGFSVDTGRPLPRSWGELLRAIPTGRIDIAAELSAQVERVQNAGLHPIHLDSHKHSHIHPAVFGEVIKVAKRYGLVFLRLPFDDGWLPGEPANWFYRRRLRKMGLRATNHFVGFRLTGVMGEVAMISALSKLSPGTTEFMCHPGYLGPDPPGFSTRLKESRLRELEALTSPRVAKEIKEQDIFLANYRTLRGLA